MSRLVDYVLNEAPVSVEATSGEEEEAEISGKAEVDDAVGLNGMWEEDPTWEDDTGSVERMADDMEPEVCARGITPSKDESLELPHKYPRRNRHTLDRWK